MKKPIFDGTKRSSKIGPPKLASSGRRRAGAQPKPQ